MATEQIGPYQIEYAGQHMGEVWGWAAYLAIYAPSRNPMHRNGILPHQRVAVAEVFASADEAAEQARLRGLALLGRPGP